MTALVNTAVFLVTPFLFLGVIGRVKSVWAGRKGPSVFQPFYDFVRLLKKGEVVSSSATLLFRAAPSVVLACTVLAALFVPVYGKHSVLSFAGDFVLFSYLVGLSKFFMAAMAMETGSPFEGMGASREMLYSTLAEPAFFLLMGSLALFTRHASFASIFSGLNVSGGISLLVVPLCMIAFFLMLLVEGCRVPFDDPNTHLELTMIHEVMILDNSGPDLAFLFYSNGLKMVLFGSLIAAFVIPVSLAPWLGLLVYLAILFAEAVLVGLVESLVARFKLSYVPQSLLLLFSITLIAFLSIISFVRWNS